MNGLRHFVKLLMLLLPLAGFSQKLDWQEIELIDTIAYTSFSTRHLPNVRYPVTNIFDMDLRTCWVSKVNEKEPAFVYIVVPDEVPPTLVMSIFSGYGKNKSLFTSNARPATLRITNFYGIVGDGFFSEHGFLAMSCKIGEAQVINLKDSFAIQQIELAYDHQAANEKIAMMQAQFSRDFGMKISEGHRIIQLEILDVFPGTWYDDVCISELYFNNRYVAAPVEKNPAIQSIYINDNEDELMFDTREISGISAYKNSTAVLQLIETSPDKRWVIILSMSTEVQGRAETYYDLIDLYARKSVTSELLTMNRSFLPGAELQFKELDGRLFVNLTAQGSETRIELCELKR